MTESRPGENRSAVLQWVIVAGVGALVVSVVLGLGLISRLNSGQDVLNRAKPAFTSERLATDVAGINIISQDVNMANPIVTPRGGGAAEVPALVAYAAKQLHTTPAAAAAAIKAKFPHTFALLGALPLSSVTREIPGLVGFLAKVLKLKPAQVLGALKTSFPHLYQAITNLPTVTNGWNNIKGMNGMTRFDGVTTVRTVPQLRDYFKNDLIPAVAAQQHNFNSLDGTSSVNWIAPLLLIVALVVVAFGAAMAFLSYRGGVSRQVSIGAAVVVPVVGVVVVALVLIVSLIPRTSNGQKLLSGLKPAFTAQRVHGDRAGISMVSSIVNMEDPIMTPRGGAAAEVPKLLAFVSSKTGLSQAQVLAALQTNFPHTASLLLALPLSAVSSELTGVVQTLGPGVTGAVPKLVPTVVNAPYVAGGWNKVAGTSGSTRFDGSPIRTVPQVRNYFSGDVIPVLESQRVNFDNLTKTSNIDFIGPLVLIVGLIVIAYGLLMVWLAWREPRAQGAVALAPPPRAGAIAGA
jgi:hypothetical protein